MTNRILDKTDKGREEIATRKHQLAPRLRTLLVMIDGKHDAQDLLKKVSGLGLNEQSITELLDNGFIHVLAGASPTVNATPDSSNAAATAAVPSNNSGVDATSSQAVQYQALYNFYTETIKSTIGLRGYGLQLKVERASTIDDFRELRQSYLEAVLKAKGNEIARSLGDRLNQLLNSVPDSIQ